MELFGWLLNYTVDITQNFVVESWIKATRNLTPSGRSQSLRF